MQLEALLAHLGPSGEDTKAARAQADSQLEAAVKKIGTISLTQSSNDTVCIAFVLPLSPLLFTSHCGADVCISMHGRHRCDFCLHLTESSMSLCACRMLRAALRRSG